MRGRMDALRCSMFQVGEQELDKTLMSKYKSKSRTIKVICCGFLPGHVENGNESIRSNKSKCGLETDVEEIGFNSLGTGTSTENIRNKSRNMLFSP